MDLKTDLGKYDGKCVRLVTADGEEFEGICSHYCAEYGMHEYGREEEGLHIMNFAFFKSDIVSVESLERVNGEYGKFSGPYGLLEELTVRGGADSMDDFLSCEEDEHTRRLLLCLRSHLAKNDLDPPIPADELRRVLENLSDTGDERIAALLRSLPDMPG